jgi:hypothetical protein
MEQHMVQGLLTLSGGLDEDGEIPLGLLLADVLPEALRPERTLLGILLEKGLGYNGLFVDIASKIDTQSLTSPLFLRGKRNQAAVTEK